MKIQHIVGMLIPTVPPVFGEPTTLRIYEALMSAELHGVISYWPNGHMELNKTAYIEDNVKSAPLGFIQRLNDMLGSEGVSELKLKGEISLLETGENSNVFRILVEDGKVSYQKSALTWEERVTL